MVGTWCYWVSIEQYWLVLGEGTGSLYGGTSYFLMVMRRYITSSGG